MQINLAHRNPCSHIYGPGVRYVLWLQGCSIRCPGCWNQKMWSTKPHLLMTVDALWQDIQQQGKAIEGITLLGGEPLDQSEATLELLDRASNSGLSTMLFTGYELEELNPTLREKLLSRVDILVSGRYIENQRTLQHQWIGSTNQQIHFLTNRYSPDIIQDANYIELSFDEDGSVRLFGFPDEESLNLLE